MPIVPTPAKPMGRVFVDESADESFRDAHRRKKEFRA